MKNPILWHFFISILACVVVFLSVDGLKSRIGNNKVEYSPYPQLKFHKFPHKKVKQQYFTFNYTNAKQAVVNLTRLKFLSLHADEEAYVDVLFNIPFISLKKNPGQRNPQDTLAYKKNFWFLANKKTALVNVNVGAAVLTVLFVLFAAVVAAAYRLFAIKYGIPQQFGVPDDNKPILIRRAFSDERLNRLAAALDTTLKKYAIAECSHRTACLLIKKSNENVAKGVAVSAEKILDGMTSAAVVRRMFAGTALDKAIAIGRISGKCEEEYPKCRIKVERFVLPFLENVIKKMS